jgi:hypothetical protein
MFDMGCSVRFLAFANQMMQLQPSFFTRLFMQQSRSASDLAESALPLRKTEEAPDKNSFF